MTSDGEIEMKTGKGALVIPPIGKPRAGWREAFQEMARRGDDALIDMGETTDSSWDWR